MDPAARKIALLICIALLSHFSQCPGQCTESHRLLFGQTFWDATDIKNFHNLTTVWLSGKDIYATEPNADYPPASWPLMFPLYILDNDVNRWVWFAHAAVVLGLLIWMCVAKAAPIRWRGKYASR